MMIQLMSQNKQMMNQMATGQQEQTKLLAKLFEEKDKSAKEMIKEVAASHLEQQKIANVSGPKTKIWNHGNN